MKPVVALPLAAFLAAAQPGARALDTDAFTFTSQPAPIVIGETGTATITIVATDKKKGAPLDVAPPHVAVSVGVIGEVDRIAPGTWKVSWGPPSSGAPQVAVFVAAIDTSAGDALGFAAIPLWARGSTTVKTKPNSSVTVVVAGAATRASGTFGPVKADAQGTATVPILVGPTGGRGKTGKAVARSVDEAGNSTEKPIDLGVPPFNRTALLAIDELAVVGLPARLVAVSVDDDGAPLSSAPVVANAKAGDGGDGGGKDLDPAVVSVGADVAPGMRIVTVKAPPAAHHIAVTTSLSGSKESQATATLPIFVGKPAGAVLTLSRDAVTEDDPDREVLVTAQIVDAAKHPVPPQAGGVNVDLGRIAAFNTDADGTRRITWIIPKASGLQRATLSVHLLDGAPLGTATVELIGGRAASRLSFEPPARFVVADGLSFIELVIHVRDRTGRTVSPDGVVVEVDPALGKVDPPTIDSHNVAHARFTPARGADTATAAGAAAPAARVVARLGDLEAYTDVPLARPAHAGPVVGGGVIVASNYGEVVAVGPEVSAVTQLPLLDGTFYAGASASVQQAVTRPAGVDDHRAVPLFGELLWRPPVVPGVQLELGLDAGPLLSDLVVDGNHSITFGLGAQFLAGAALHAGPGTVCAYARFGSALYFGNALAQTAIGLPLGAGVVAGYRFEL